MKQIVSAALIATLGTGVSAQETDVVRTLFTNVNVYDGVTPVLSINAHVLV